ncbi:hypothetical protein MHYP_G00050350 [Metynnis hypsauchen]
MGFSPNELVFAHTVRGPTAVVADNWNLDDPPENVVDYVRGFRYRRYQARAVAHRKLGKAQTKMQRLFDRKAQVRKFEPGDQVLALLPVVGSPFQAKFGGPYTIDRSLSGHNYLLRTPDRRKKTQVCHLNLLKPYHPSVSVGLIAKTCWEAEEDEYVDTLWEANDGVKEPSQEIVEGRLQNTEMRAALVTYLSHLTEQQRSDILELVESFVSLFPDVPGCTSILEHDIDVGVAQPIKQQAYRVSPVKREILRREVNYLRANNLVEPSCSAWSSPCLLVNKPDGTYRFCTDYRRLNAVTKPDCYPLPRVDDCVDRVGSAIFVNASDRGVGAVLMQMGLDGIEHPVCYFSAKFNRYQRAYSTIEKEALALILALQHFEVYVSSTVGPVTVYTDHNPLVFIAQGPPQTTPSTAVVSVQTSPTTSTTHSPQKPDSKYSRVTASELKI